MHIKEQARILFLEKKYNCCQAVVCAYCQEKGISESEVYRLAEAFGGGMGGMQDTCGAVTGMFMALGLQISAGDPSDPRKSKGETYEEVQKAADTFRAACGSLYCREIKARSEGKPVVSCVQCVETAAEYLDKYLNTLAVTDKKE